MSSTFFVAGILLTAVLLAGTAAYPFNITAIQSDESAAHEGSPREGRQYPGYFPGQNFGRQNFGNNFPNFGYNLANANAFASPAGSNANSFSATGDILNGFTLSNANTFHTPGLNSFIGGK